MLHDFWKALLAARYWRGAYKWRENNPVLDLLRDLWDARMRSLFKYWVVLMPAVLLSMSACVVDEEIISTAAPTLVADVGAKTGRCGDGICNGPESLISCPLDCNSSENPLEPLQATNAPSIVSPIDNIHPLYFFYAIHVHGSGEYLPYDGPGLQDVNPEVAENMIAAVEDIAEVLNRHGVKGTWETLPAVATGFCSYQGENHVLRKLIDQGHEVGTHAHRIDDIQDSYEALVRDCGIIPRTTSGFIAQISPFDDVDAQNAISLAIEASLNFGMGIGTTNLSPGGGKNPFAELCDNQIGPDNSMWMQSGNLMYPWRPDYMQRDVCAEDNHGGMILIDHVSIEWILLPGQEIVPDILAEEHFDQLQNWFDGALQFMEDEEPARMAVWGFVTHITEYAKGSHGENPLDPAALAALDRFLAYVSYKGKEGRVIFATVEEIADLISPEN